MVFETRRGPPSGVIAPNRVDSLLFAEWRAGAESLIAALVPPGHPFAVQFAEVKEPLQRDAEKGLGILRALRSELDAGLLLRLESLAAADIFDDFLDMTEHLLDAGYKDPAASLAGAVLEDGLRKVASARGVAMKPAGDISSLDQRLADGQVYSRLAQRKIRLWKAVRDHADHGRFSEYREEDVRQMVAGVRDLLTELIR